MINSTYSFGTDDIGSDKKASDSEDVLYQRDASFSAKLDGFPTSDEAAGIDVNHEDDDTAMVVISNDIAELSQDEPKDSLLRTKPKLTVRWLGNTSPVVVTSRTSTTTPTASSSGDASSSTTAQSFGNGAGDTNLNFYPAFKEDMSIYDDVNNNRLNLRSPSEMYQILGTVLREDQQQQEQQKQSDGAPSLMMDTTTTTLPFPASTAVDATSHSYIQIDVFDNRDAQRLFDDGAQETTAAAAALPSSQPETISRTEVAAARPTIASTVEQPASTTTR